MKRKMWERLSFCVEEAQFNELTELSRRTGTPKSIFLREALAGILKRYRYITTMEPPNKELIRYRMAKKRMGIQEEP